MKYIKQVTATSWSALTFLVIFGCCLAACKEDNLDIKLGAVPVPAFTVTPLTSNPNKIVVQSTTPGAFMWLWDFGNGSTARGETDTVLYTKKGDYDISLTAFGQGGSAAATQKVSIADDVKGLDLVKGGDMTDASDWTVLNTGGTQTTITFSDAGTVFTNADNSNGGIYQAIQVEAGAQYKFSANVAGSGATNTWFEVYFGTTAPAQGSDYSDNKFVSMNTWSGCGSGPFNGDIAAIGCDGSGTGANGMITFNDSGTVYLVIKAGSAGGSLGAGGITLTNVSVIKL